MRPSALELNDTVFFYDYGEPLRVEFAIGVRSVAFAVPQRAISVGRLLER